MAHSASIKIALVWQVAICILASVLLTAVDVRFGYQSPFNLIWMLGVPIGMGVWFNESLTRKIVVSVVMLVVFHVASSLMVQAIWGGF
ncbi:MAG: hypothetical protein C0474_11305 [Sphingobium sp.]|nr:hypothetical protein [Sphingobium sp.]